MENYLLSKIFSVYTNATLEKKIGNQSFITGILPKGFEIEIMPNHYNDFVIRFKNLEFFKIVAFEKYFKKTLLYKDVTFKVNSLSIYVYINQKQNSEYHFTVFEYVKNEIEKIIKTILESLDDSNINES